MVYGVRLVASLVKMVPTLKTFPDRSVMLVPPMVTFSIVLAENKSLDEGRLRVFADMVSAIPVGTPSTLGGGKTIVDPSANDKSRRYDYGTLH